MNILHPENFRGRVTAFFTGKNPGVSIKEISRFTKTSESHIYLPIQKHTDKVIVLDSDLSPLIGDAVITNNKGMIIGVQVADCVPILLYDMKREVIGAVHAGWRGTAEAILIKTIRMLSSRYNSDPEDIVVAMGPSVKWCCYEVDHNVAQAVGKATGKGEYVRRKGEKFYLDLPAANKYQAMSEGIKEENIWTTPDCTFCNPDRYCSYRYAKGPTCRQGGFIGMSDK
jgi:hypothetical protein